MYLRIGPRSPIFDTDGTKCTFSTTRLGNMAFACEEMSIGLRGFTIGYDYFAPEKSVCFHSYAKRQKCGRSE